MPVALSVAVAPAQIVAGIPVTPAAVNSTVCPYTVIIRGALPVTYVVEHGPVVFQFW